MLDGAFGLSLDNLPEFLRGGNESSFEIDGTRERGQPQARVMLVDQRYLDALRIPLLQGRIWNADENTRGDFTAVVNRAFATRYLSSSNALGRQLRIPGLARHTRFGAVSAQSTAWRQIIGVVGDARNDGVDRPIVPAIYLPYTTVMQPYVQFFVRTQGDSLTYLHSIRVAIASVASDQQISDDAFNGTFTLDEAIQRDPQWSRQRLFSVIFGVFSAMALALALVGIFSVVAYSVAQRTSRPYPLGRRPRRPHQYRHRRCAWPRPRRVFRKASRPLDAQRPRRRQSVLRRRAARPQCTPRVYAAGPPRYLRPTRRSIAL
ncbi:MAG TPA: ABC transporter permease [Edaphobacter sp.]|nr:ABC transporter permease [Edaphobacter sp.]